MKQLILISMTLALPAWSQTRAFGTPMRIEQEFKLAYQYSKGFPLKKVLKIVQEELDSLVSSGRLKFNKVVGKSYFRPPGIRTFVFNDYYLDTNDYSLFKKNSDYRLRYRWNNYNSFLGHSFFPILSFFYPNRCEIQFKSGYQRKTHPQLVIAQETRFEFRNESSPFDKDNSAPPPPWPFNEFIEYAKSGKYKQYGPILPYRAMRTVLKNREKLSRVIPLKTIRYRTHLHLDTPWGSGPNPTQAFIISIDLVSAEKEFKFLEVEIELERNVSTQLDLMVNPPEDLIKRLFKDGEMEDAKALSMRAKKAYEEDQFLVAETIESRLSKFLRPLPTRSKYKRVVGNILGQP